MLCTKEVRREEVTWSLNFEGLEELEDLEVGSMKDLEVGGIKNLEASNLEVLRLCFLESKELLKTLKV